MIEICGKYSNAIIYQDDIEAGVYSQIYNLLNQKFVEGEKIRIMPDCHQGKGAVIGYTQTINNNRIVPSTIGVDIACGVRVVELGKINIDFPALDNFIHNNIPAGHAVNENPVREFTDLENLHCWKEIKSKEDLFRNSIGSLGGGNHFVEIDRDDEGNYYLLIHTGSRNLGKTVAEYYQRKAIDYHKRNDWNVIAEALIAKAKLEGKQKELQSILSSAKKKYEGIPAEYAYLVGNDARDYLEDVKICTLYATLNRYTIAEKICEFLGLGLNGKINVPTFETLHNYIDIENKIIRKGSVSALEGERLIIPINMKDGALICIGKGNSEYNYSAPHGAGRLFSRSEAKNSINLKDFEESMEGIYTTCVCEATIDESCFAYRGIEQILPNIIETVDVEKRIFPVYNFKAID